MSISRAGVRSSVAAAIVLAALLWPARPAAAHPLGPPPEAVLEVAGDRVTVHWSAQRDDLYTIARSIGAVADEMIFEEVNGQVVQVGGDSDADLLALSEELPGYFRQTIRVAQDGEDCVGTLESRPTYDGDPAVMAYRCDAPIGDLSLTLTALTEFDDTYRTILRAPGAQPQRGLHTASRPTATYTFSAAAAAAEEGAGLPGWSLTAIAAGVVVAGLVTSRALRRGRHAAERPTTATKAAAEAGVR